MKLAEKAFERAATGCGCQFIEADFCQSLLGFLLA